MIIGVSGKAGAGKDEFAAVAKRYGAVRIAFADGVKDEAAEFLAGLGLAPIMCRLLYGTQDDKETEVSCDLGRLISVALEFKWHPDEFSSFQEGIRYDENKNPTFTLRYLLQWWGTEFRRNQDENYWIHKAFNKCRHESCLYVISDVRFPNEARAIRSAGGSLVRVARDLKRSCSNATHPSETALDNWGDWDMLIANDAGLDDYRELCEQALNQLIDGGYKAC